MAYAVAHNISAIRAAKQVTPQVEIKPITITPPPVLSSDLWGEEKETPLAEKSPELQTIEQLCRIHNKNMFVRVKHPIRTNWMRLYSVIIDLQQTYHWSEARISNWLQFARECCLNQ